MLVMIIINIWIASSMLLYTKDFMLKLGCEKLKWFESIIPPLVSPLLFFRANLYLSIDFLYFILG